MQNNTTFQNKFLTTVINSFKLARAGGYTGYLLVFFPVAFSIVITKNIVDIKLWLLFILGSISTRSFGCVINDVLDRNFDKHVLRTKNRPLASDQISIKAALILLFILGLLSLYILLSLRPLAIYIGLIAAILIMIYPLMKRFTYFPQVFLGVTFNIGTLIAYAQITNSISIAVIILYLACIFWTVGYDTIYGFMDIDYDKKINVKSLSILLEDRYKIFISIFYIIFIGLFTIASILSDISFNLYYYFITIILLVWQVYTLDIQDPNNCFSRFKSNNYVGIMLLLSLVM